MTGYPYLEDLFRAVLGQSKAIQGRFYIASKAGHEINSDNLSQVLQQEVNPIIGNKYPLVLMMAPVSLGMYGSEDAWDEHRITLFFLKTTYRNGDNSIANINPDTQTSMHTVPQDWHDMKRCAVSFLRVIQDLEDNLLLRQHFILSGRSQRVITPISLIGTDRVSGVRLDFSASLFAGCDLEDYPSYDAYNIVLPAPDSHPEHNL